MFSFFLVCPIFNVSVFNVKLMFEVTGNTVLNYENGEEPKMG